MAGEIVLRPASVDLSLAAMRVELAAMRGALADRELQLTDLRAQLRAFESRYMLQVGVLYATLDDWEARIAEREVDLYDSEEARRRAEECRQRATQTHDAAYAPEFEAGVEEFNPPASLKTLFRELAKRIHPDFARDAVEQAHFTRLMARANIAYNRGDGETLQRLLDDQHETTLHGDGSAGELPRITRQISHARRDLAALGEEQAVLLSSDIAHLYRDAEGAKSVGRQLLQELAAGLREKVSEAERRFEKIDREITAHGR